MNHYESVKTVEAELAEWESAKRQIEETLSLVWSLYACKSPGIPADGIAEMRGCLATVLRSVNHRLEEIRHHLAEMRSLADFVRGVVAENGKT